MSNRTKATAGFQATLSVAALKALVSSTSGAVARVTTIPILSHIKLMASGETVTMTACDLERQISKTVNASGFLASGAVWVPGHALGDIAARLAKDGDVTMVEDLDKGRVVITSGRARFELPTLPADDFPTLSSPDLAPRVTGDNGQGATFDVLGTEFARMLAITSTCLGQDETRIYLAGVFLAIRDGKFVAVATDGHRLARMIGNLPPGAETMPGIIVPSKTVATLIKQLNDSSMAGAMAQVTVSPTKIQISVGEWVLTSKLIDGTFPDYTRVIPADTGKTQVRPETREFLDAIARCSIIKSGRTAILKCVFSRDGVALSASGDTGSAQEDVHADVDGKGLTIGFNAAYLATVLATIGDADDAVMHLSDSSSPMRVDVPSLSLTFVLMPMRV